MLGCVRFGGQECHLIRIFQALIPIGFTQTKQPQDNPMTKDNDIEGIVEFLDAEKKGAADLVSRLKALNGEDCGFAKKIEVDLYDQAISKLKAQEAEIERLRGDTLFFFQHRVSKWIAKCFSKRIANAKRERVFRFLEEALELAQSLDLTEVEAKSVVDYVYGRDIGRPHQEVGGVMVTLAALCMREEICLQDAALGEIERIEQPEIIKKIRAKQDAKSAVGMGMKTIARKALNSNGET